MALAPYFGRIHDSVGTVADIGTDDLADLLLDLVVHVRIASDIRSDPAALVGAQLLVNLLSRLYPRLRLSCPQVLKQSLLANARRTNPQIEVVDDPGAGRELSVAFGGEPDEVDADVHVTASGWLVIIDGGSTGGDAAAGPVMRRPANSLAWQVAACLTSAELFRAAFSDVLGRHARRCRQPGQFNLLNGSQSDADCLTDLRGVALPDLHLAGGGAIGQAALLALRDSGVRAKVTVVDPETVGVSNLQRYVLSNLPDVGRLKVDVVVNSMAGGGVDIVPVATVWGQDSRSAPRRPVVLAALDSARDRLGVAAGLHNRVYNAWTQPADLGWSRHERFGTDPCLACLYLPTGPRPSEDEQIAAALGQHRLRVLSYFVTDVPVGEPLPLIPAVGDVPPPPDTEAWLTTSLLDDLVASGYVAAEAAAHWRHVRIDRLYQDGVCGAGLIEARPGLLERDVAVPLAHQSALAGVLLAVSVIAAHVPALAEHRSDAVEMRLDLRLGLPQVPGRPRRRTPGCICADADYRSAALSSALRVDARTTSH